MKAYVERDESAVVKRVTTVPEPDSESDCMDQQYTEVVVLGTLDCPNREAGISEWVTEYSDTLTKEPGMTDLTDFFIDTGDSMPIAQTP